MNKEQENLITMVETIIDTILDLKNQGMSDFMIKEMMLAMASISLKEQEKEMFN